MSAETVYLSLGSNIGNRVFNLQQAIQKITAIPNTQEHAVSRFYETSPISNIPQNDYLNAACRFKTTMFPLELLQKIQTIEFLLGKTSSTIKNAPRKIDIDILFFGSKVYRNEQPFLEIPHPRWKERLFVIIPCLDLTQTITLQCKQTGEETVNLIKLKDSLNNKSQLIKIYS
jgi:2-amino-4-hydroxy-6-hydroxymethyldihydropteridine diphosphokinase